MPRSIGHHAWPLFWLMYWLSFLTQMFFQTTKSKCIASSHSPLLVFSCPLFPPTFPLSHLCFPPILMMYPKNVDCIPLMQTTSSLLVKFFQDIFIPFSCICTWCSHSYIKPHLYSFHTNSHSLDYRLPMIHFYTSGLTQHNTEDDDYD